MNHHRIGTLLFVAVVLGTSSLAFSQQQRVVERTVPLPDSLKGHLSSRVDEAKIRTNWEKLKKGMTFKQVEQLFGRPTKIAGDMHDTSTTWYSELGVYGA